MFQVGQEVVCINDGPFPYQLTQAGFKWDNRLKKNEHYIVRWEGLFYSKQLMQNIYCVKLIGITRRIKDTPFSAERFVPVKKENIEVFQEMCNKTKINALSIRDEHEKDLNSIFIQAILSAKTQALKGLKKP